MDLMMFQSIIHSTTYPLQDLWLARFPVSYYYFGYWLQALPAQWMGGPPSTMYNIAQAMWFSLTLLGCFGIGYNLARIRKLSTFRAALSGAVSALAVLCISNLQGFIDALHPGDGWWWWPASRAITDSTTPVITEFPFFSYLLGDMHPHMQILPFMLMLLGWCLHRLTTRDTCSSHETTKAACTDFIFPALLTATLFMTNAWNWPVAVLLLLLTLLFCRLPIKTRMTHIIIMTGFILLASLPLLFPYHLTAQSQVQGLALFHGLHTQPAEWFMVFGCFIPGLLLLFGKLIQRTVQKRSFPVPARFLLLLVFVGAVCVILPEFVYIKDCFNNRMNMVFKFYYQGWLFLALASAAVMALSITDGHWRFLAVPGLCLLTLGLLYPARVLYDVTEHFTPSPTGLDGSAWISRTAPEQARALDWIQNNTETRAVFLTAPGKAYRPLSSAVSTYAGRPQLLGWPGHERQWRGDEYTQMTDKRMRFINLCFKNGSPTQILSHDLWPTIDYIYVGPQERAFSHKKPLPIEKMIDFIQPVFSNNKVVIYATIQ